MGNGNKEVVKVEQQSGVPSEMIQLAISKGADLDKLEKLLTLQERYEANQAKKAYHEAMAAFKANPPKIDKDQTVKYKDVKYNHASLYNVTEKINAALSKHGLSASWKTQQNGAIIVTCKITHVKGHSEETTLSAPADNSGSKNAIQAIGSTITYLQRYSLLSLTGLATVEQDDDGRAAGGNGAEHISDEEAHRLVDMLIDKNIDPAKFCKAFNINDVRELPKVKLEHAHAAIKKAKGGKK